MWILPSFSKTRRSLLCLKVNELTHSLGIASESLVLSLTPISTIDDELHKSVCAAAEGLQNKTTFQSSNDGKFLI